MPCAPTHATDSGPVCGRYVVVDGSAVVCQGTVYGYVVTNHRTGNVVATCAGCGGRLQWTAWDLFPHSHVRDVRAIHSVEVTR